MVQWYNGTLSIANSYFFLEKLFIQENFDCHRGTDSVLISKEKRGKMEHINNNCQF